MFLAHDSLRKSLRHGCDIDCAVKISLLLKKSCNKFSFFIENYEKSKRL